LSELSIDKQKIIDQLKHRLQVELDKAKQAFETTRKHTTSKELQAEGKYDTRSIEAGYLAGAQKKRVAELEQEVELLGEINIKHTPEAISVGSLAEIEFNQIKRLYFISSSSGGTLLKVDEHPILVISAFSPIGIQAIGLGRDESFFVERPDEVRQYQIINIF
jgi:transcription elongation GreA/GreB family factor